jgi:hypothetical protein
VIDRAKEAAGGVIDGVRNCGSDARAGATALARYARSFPEIVGQEASRATRAFAPVEPLVLPLVCVRNTTIRGAGFGFLKRRGWFDAGSRLRDRFDHNGVAPDVISTLDRNTEAPAAAAWFLPAPRRGFPSGTLAWLVLGERDQHVRELEPFPPRGQR